MFGNKDKDKNAKAQKTAEKAPTSFNSPVSSVIPKPGNKESKTARSSSTTLIAHDTEIVGDIKFFGNLEIEGVVRGTILANPGSEASVRILEKGRVEGDIHAPKVAINGAVKGTVHSSILELASNARIAGDVHYHTVEMQRGSQVNGSLVFTEKNASAAAAPKPVNKDAQADKGNQGKDGQGKAKTN